MGDCSQDPPDTQIDPPVGYTGLFMATERAVAAKPLEVKAQKPHNIISAFCRPKHVSRTARLEGYGDGLHLSGEGQQGPTAERHECQQGRHCCSHRTSSVSNRS